MAALTLTLSACNSGDDGVVAVRSEGEGPNASVAATPFYADFRTRPYFFITHTFITYGAQDPAGHPLEQKAIGFYPSTGGAFGPWSGLPAWLARKITSSTFPRQPTTAGI